MPLRDSDGDLVGKAVLFAAGDPATAQEGEDVAGPIRTADGDLAVSKQQLDAITVAADTTANRPASPTVGQQYYDTTLLQPIWWNGTNWTDAMGTTV